MTEDRRIVFVVFLLLLISFGAYSQKTKAQLQKEKQDNLKKIQETERILAETGQQKKNSLGELVALNQRIRQQETLIKSIQNEISLLNADINKKSEIINALEDDLAKLREEYAAMLFATQKASGKINKLMFLFSSSSFDQLLMRLKYMEQYGAARKDQAEVIARVQTILTDQIKETENIKDEKS
ncbi:MAG: peptidase M23, partial [Cyclobacteriaceae bacterium]